MYWNNGDICSGEILDNICNGTNTTPGAQESKGEFHWSFHHASHEFTYNG